jgi:predicted anti-sigma-YlaC factor YlaD
MNEHVNGWLTAYFDGELDERQSDKVRAHLEECSSCRKELAALGSLRRLLGENPEARGLLSAKQFAAQVSLRLPRRPSRSISRRAIAVAWGAIPAALLGIWAFVQTLFILIEASGLAANLGLWGNELALFDTSTVLNALLLNLGVSGLVAVALMSWLASWWIRRQDRTARQATE